MKKIYLLLLLISQFSQAQDCNVFIDDFSSYGCYNCSLTEVSPDWINYYDGASEPNISAGGSISNPNNERYLDITSHFSQGNDTVVYDAINTISIEKPGIILYTFDFYNECGRLYIELLSSFTSATEKEVIKSLIIDWNELIFDENETTEKRIFTPDEEYKIGLEINFYDQRLNILFEDSLVTSELFDIDAQEIFGIAFGSNQCNFIDDMCISHAIIDNDGDGYDYRFDCDDNNMAINPGVMESPYNGLDDDCDPATPDDDLDGDGFVLADDCDDLNADINPGITETPYNGLDDDCDATTPDDDLDGDGFVLADDCDDLDADINPGITETPYNGLDDDCDATTPDDDLDGDGFVLAEDCDDLNADINPGITETPYNGLDDDCDATTPDDDLDGDGFVLSEDCDDLDADINPLAEEIANNGIDEDCNGEDLIITNVHELSPHNLIVYPNPASDYVEISNEKYSSFDITIFSIVGKKKMTATEVNCLDVSKLATGIYLLHITESNTTNIVVERLVIN